MEIRLENIGKRFGFEWIFKKIDYHFEAGEKYAILGANGSGKSTLMKILSGHLTPSKGNIQFTSQGKNISVSDTFQYISYAAPYIELIEEFSLKELLSFHTRFRPFTKGLTAHEVVEIMEFSKAVTHREVKYYSSGMKQRVKLALALLSDSPILLLDEPTTNLDTKSMDWYLLLIEQFTKNRTVIVATNEERDYSFCHHFLHIFQYK